ncbi:ArsI/CadI family heavy metal resistance metalloenzyme [Sphingoaurantiacus capsulatus]|uniref:ArsI/CadI family heavy metal resistance metalloenzyme n=1 Tax=Sphingoaurantiacus capsulatus TaxID=1771310 RepID=A0ABV7XCN2_9SPHN
MKRLHVHVSVENLQQSIGFYSTLFANEPTVTKPDYAKWMLDDPRLNFAISTGQCAATGIEHLGIQVETAAELSEVYDRLKAADRPVLEEGATTCCYAKSEKSWIADPQGVVWETFFTTGEATDYGVGPGLNGLTSASAAADACCVPAMPAIVAPASADKCCA